MSLILKEDERRTKCLQNRIRKPFFSLLRYHADHWGETHKRARQKKNESIFFSPGRLCHKVETLWNAEWSVVESSPLSKCTGRVDNVSPPPRLLTPPLCSVEASCQKLSGLVEQNVSAGLVLFPSCSIQHLPITLAQTTSHYHTIQIRRRLSFIVNGRPETCNYFSLSPPWDQSPNGSDYRESGRLWRHSSVPLLCLVTV